MPSDYLPSEDVLNDMPDILLGRIKDIALLVTHAAEAENVELVLERIAQVSAQLVNAKYAALGVPDDRGGLRYFKVAGLTPEQIRQIPHPPRGHGLLGEIMNGRQVIRLERMQDDPRSCGFPSGHPSMSSLLGVPIMLGEELHGMLYLSDRKDGQPFSEHDQWVIEVMASYAALAIANSVLQEQRSRLAMLEERERIGMELHDGVIQSIYAIGMQVDLVCNAAKEGTDTQELKRVIGGLNTVIEDIRKYIQNLRARSEQRSTIRECLEEILLRIHVPDKLTIDIGAPDLPAPLPASTFEAVCQIVHEALSNVVRHANATYVHIEALIHDDHFEIVIEDNGLGFDISSMRNHNGLGLSNIQQRARLHGGQVTITSRLGAGTKLAISIPTRVF